MNALHVFSHLIFPKARNAGRRAARSIFSWALGILAGTLVGVLAVPVIFLIGFSMPIVKCIQFARGRRRPRGWSDWVAMVPLSWPLFGIAFYGSAAKAGMSTWRARRWARKATPAAMNDPNVIPFASRQQPHADEDERLNRLERAQ